MREILAKAQSIKLVIFDVDGILTDGKLFFTESGEEIKAFHVHDGQGIKLLQQTGVAVAVITGRQSACVTHRLQELNIVHSYQGQSDKLQAYHELKQKLALTDVDIAYLGDDLPDLPLIRRSGLGITVPNAPAPMAAYADWVTTKAGGQGAAREVCDVIMQAQGHYAAIIDSFLGIS